MTTAMASSDEHRLKFEETELRLGLPGAEAESSAKSSCTKRGFSETVDLKLNLSSEDSASLMDRPEKKTEESSISRAATNPAKPPAKAQVVGWPPVRSFRKNILTVQKSNANEESEKVGWPPVRSFRKNILTVQQSNANEESEKGSTAGAAFVKVSVDGAPYLRKVDLKMYRSYQQLSDALAKMFSSFTIGNYGSQGMKDFMNETKLIDLLNGSDYVPTYEDKDGDWMLVGDVPWEMFVDSCKRLRIMKGSEAVGLAPRALEKRKSRV